MISPIGLHISAHKGDDFIFAGEAVGADLKFSCWIGLDYFRVNAVVHDLNLGAEWLWKGAFLPLGRGNANIGAFKMQAAYLSNICFTRYVYLITFLLDQLIK